MFSNSKSSPKTKVVAALVAAASLGAFLAGCGGGGGDSTTTGPVAAVPSAAASGRPANIVDLELSTLVTSIPASTYPAGSELKAGFDKLNAERATCGFGLMAQNAALDQAAASHASWVNANNTVSHNETVGTKSFTGVFVLDRVKAAGYPAIEADSASEVGTVLHTSNSGGSASALAVSGNASVVRLLSAPYHGNALLGPMRDVGLGIKANFLDDLTTAMTGFWMNMAYLPPAGTQKLAGTTVATYPCEGIKDTGYKLTDESPSPVPGRNLTALPLGMPVYVRLRELHVLKITASFMTESATGVSVKMRDPITSVNDPQGPCALGCFAVNEGYVIPDAALKPLTQYHVSISGTNNGVAFTKVFDFTTGNTD